MLQRSLITSVGLLLLLGCPSDPNENTGDDTPPPDKTITGVTYHKDIRAIVEDNCLSCHVEGGIGPFQLDSFEEMDAYAASVVTSVEAGRMPPWLPDPDCRHYTDERILTAEQKQLFRAWVDNGKPEGDEADYVPTVESGLTVDIGEPSVTVAIPEPYTPDSELPDDHHCFVMDIDFAEETFLRTSNVLPDKTDLVHHVILFLVPPQFVSAVQALDAADPGPGYGCFGGVGAGQPQPIAGWVPGTPITPGSEDAAVRIPAGSKVVMQMHYNTISATPVPDQSSIQLWFLDEQPQWLLQAEFLPHLGIEIEAGDADSYQVREFVNNGSTPWTLVQTGPHMHLLGTRQRVSKVAADGSEECLVDIPRWDFNWQQGYGFLENELVTVAPGEKILLECWYDNSASNQPVVNGVQLQPQRVTWGEGTLDEMCLNTMVFLEPYSPLPSTENVCMDFQPCYDQCMGGGGFFPMTGCVLQCVANDGDCATCTLGGMINCTINDCGRQSENMLQCFESCAGGPATCIRDQCTNQILSYDGCARPIIDTGICDDTIGACNVEL